MIPSAMFLFSVFLLYGANGDTIPVACSKNFNSYDFCNTKLSIDNRVNNLISLLTLDEKALLLTARESPLNFIPRLGIPEYDWGTNCIHSAQSRCGSKCSTTFPNPNALGASFNKTLIQNISVAIGLELRALWLEGMGENHASNLPHLGLDCWSPTVNLGRDPRWGRMYEVPSEDPIWNGFYGKHYTLGLQNGSKDSAYYDANHYLAITTLKHFDAYSLENDHNGTTRHNFNAIVSPYMFEDSYFPAFEMSIVEGGAKGVMCSYNSVNGVPSCCNDFLLNQTLRQSWSFTGYVTSDSGAINDIFTNHKYANESQAVVDSLTASCDINSGVDKSSMGGNWGTGSKYQETIPSVVNSGALDIKFVNKALFNTLKLRFELGLFDPIANQPYWKVPGSIINNAQHRQLNVFATQSSMTLLKNDGILPFNPSDNKQYAVIGPHYNASHDMLGSYLGQICYDGSSRCVPGVLQGVANYVGASHLFQAQGCDVKCTSSSGFAAALDVANKADNIILVMGLNIADIEKESSDRTNISLPGYQYNLAEQICNLKKPTVLVLINGGMIGIDGLKESCPAIVEAFYPGFRGAEGISDVLFGKVNPGGKLATTMYYSNYSKVSNFTEMDLTVGLGKTYKYWKGETIYPFAYGLSYTQFTFQSDTSCVAPKYCVVISNVGDREGRETIFVFVVPPTTIPSNEPASNMKKRLVDFDKFYLEKGGSVTFEYVLDEKKDLMLFNSKGEPTLFSGEYGVLFSNGVDQNLHVTVKVNETVSLGKAKAFPRK